MHSASVKNMQGCVISQPVVLYTSRGRMCGEGACPGGGAGLGCRTTGMFLVALAVLCLPATVASRTNRVSHGEGVKLNLHQETQVTNQQGFDQCKWRAVRGHCDFYTCLDEQLQCVGTKHNWSMAYRFCDGARHHAANFTAQGRRWARYTNRCTLKMIAQTRYMKRDEWCSRVDGATRQALVGCARISGICQVLWSDRQVLHRIFSDGSWFTLIEAGKECPRAVVSRFIFWAIAHMDLPS